MGKVLQIMKRRKSSDGIGYLVFVFVCVMAIAVSYVVEFYLKLQGKWN